MVILMISMTLFSVGWPLAPQDSTHPICNNYGAFQEFTDIPCYLHNAIDVLGDSGTPIHAVADGYVKAWVNTGGGSPHHWAMPIGDEYGADSCDGWMYAHIDASKYHLNLGDTCSAGELIGYVVPWWDTGQPVRISHVHFTRIRSGGYPWTWVVIIQNPLSLVTPIIDTLNPVFEDAVANSRFAFCRDNTSDYLDPDSLTGDVDIIAHIYDCTGEPTTWPEWDKLIPYKIEYRIHGPDTVPTTRFMEFSGLLLDWDDTETALTIYKNDVVCNSRFNYGVREYYFIVTNTDGDTLIEPSDTLGCWETTLYDDGTYWVVVTAYDIVGNSTSDSMQVTLQNENAVEEWPSAKQREKTYFHTTIFSGPLLLPEDKKGRVFDISGRVVAPDRIRPGIYFIEVEGKITQKVVKVR